MKKVSSNTKNKWWYRWIRSGNWFAFRYWWFVWLSLIAFVLLYILKCCDSSPSNIRVDNHRYKRQLAIIDSLIDNNCECIEEENTESLSFPADYLIITYQFDKLGGKDLDTRTSILSPIQSEEVGYCNRNNRILSDYIFWGGDNRGYGVESCLIDLTQFENDAEVVIDCAATWWSIRKTGNMSLDIRAYKGGVMKLGTDFQFYNENGEESAYTSFEDNIEFCCGTCPITEEIGMIKYNKKTQTLMFTPK